MARLCFFGLLVAGLGDARSAENSTGTPQSFHDIHVNMRAVLRHEAQAADPTDWASTVVLLTEIYGDIMRDARLPSSDTLESYRVKLRSRLLRIQKNLQWDIKRTEKAGDRAVRQEHASDRRVTEQLAMLLSLSGDSLGGPSTVYQHGGGLLGAGGGAARGDYGPALVELIRRTISPDSWDVNGGRGVIVYYRPWYALVVRATDDVHRQIGGVIGGGRE